ncbi:hypothetical protein Tco_0161468 [Tanacetum coccineum]
MIVLMHVKCGKAIERLKQGKSINVQDLETNLYLGVLENSHHGMVKSLESYYSRFYKMMNELVRNQCDVTNHQVNVQFLLQLQPEWHKFADTVKLSQSLRFYHPQNHPTHYTNNSSTRSQPAATINRGKAIINSSTPTYDQEPAMVADDDEMSKEKEIDKLMALISLSFNKIYKPTNNNLRTSSNTSRSNQDNYPRINSGTGYGNQRVVNVVGARENVGTQDAAYHKEKMLLFKQEEAGVQLNAKQADWKDDTDNESDDQGLEAHYIVQIDDDQYKCDKNITIDSLDMSNNEQTVDQDDDDDLAKERDLLASLIEKLKCEIDDSKNRNKFLESSKKALVDKLKIEIEDFKNKNKSLESLNNHFKEENNELSKTNQLMFKDLKKFQDELEKRHDVNYMSKVELDYMKNELFAHQETISIMSQEKEAQIKFYKTRKDKELDKVIALENKVKVLDDIVYKTRQSVQTMNMLNRNCKMSFAKPEFLKKAQRANPRLYDIGCYNDNLTLMLAPESDKMIRLPMKVDQN